MSLILAVSAKPGCVKSIGVVSSDSSLPPGSVGTPAMCPGPRRRPQPQRLLELPGLAPVEAAGEHVLLGPLPIDRMPAFGSAIAHVAPAEADEDLIAPRPDPVIGGPSAIPTRRARDHHVRRRHSERCRLRWRCVLAAPGPAPPARLRQSRRLRSSLRVASDS